MAVRPGLKRERENEKWTEVRADPTRVNQNWNQLLDVYTKPQTLVRGEKGENSTVFEICCGFVCCLET